MKYQMAIWKNLIKFALMKRLFNKGLCWLPLFIGIYTIIQMSACANIVPPTGGPRDTIAPYLLVAKPKDSALNVRPKEIWVGFNEYININSIQENLIVSPSLKNTPLVDAKLNVLKISIKDSLADNTTYSLQFGEAIKDVNEGNTAKNFTYVFSTGNYLDTGSLKGTVKLAETGKVDSTLLVVLHPTDNDSAIFKNKPLYYTKINGKGHFEFKFLPYKNFNVFVIPNDYNKKYDDSTKLFAFANSPINIKAKTDSLNLFAFEAAKKIEKKRISGAAVKSIKKNSALLKYTRSLEGNEQDLLHDLVLGFETPVHLNDSFPIQLCDTLNKPISDFSLTVDSASPQNIIIGNTWTAKAKYHLIIPQKSVKDSLGNFLIKSDTIVFKAKSNEVYGSCIIRFNGYQNWNHPILLLTQDDKIKFSYPITQNLLNIEQLPGGDFQLKILEDENNNGKWDTGKYGAFKLQPEKVTLLSQKLNIKASWDNELNLVINK
jgi:hypothetical protein